ncbi:hypothetical protein BCEP27_20163 [Burkholderia cepacia]
MQTPITTFERDPIRRMRKIRDVSGIDPPTIRRMARIAMVWNWEGFIWQYIYNKGMETT